MAVCTVVHTELMSIMSLREVMDRYGIRFKKGLGQNLLLDDNINRIMVEAAALSPEDDVVEVGAGLGALTQRLQRRAGRILAIEIDRSFMPYLEEQFAEAENIELFRGDVLNHPLDKLVSEFIPGGTSYKMVSNLPYYITTPILFHFLESPVFFRRIVVMVQEEVAQRMSAATGSRDYGVLAIACRYHAEVDIVHRVPRTCFAPRPAVDSCVVRLRCRETPLYPDLDGELLLLAVRAGFAQRRKMLHNSLMGSQQLAGYRQYVPEALDAAGIDGTRRPQTLSLDEWAELARRIQGLAKEK